MAQRTGTAGTLRDAMIHGAVDRWISVDEAQAITGRSKWSWRRDVYASKIGSSRVGRRLFLRLSDVNRVMEAGYRPSAAELERLQERAAG